MRTWLVSIATETTPLDGAFYEPDSGGSGRSVLLLHGFASNFLTGPSRFLPPVLVDLGLSCLAFNRRGHDILAIRDSRAPEGGALSTVRAAIADVDTGAGWLRGHGLAAPIVVGHSYGGTLAVRHAAMNPDTPALILLSAHVGKLQVQRTGVFAGPHGAALIREAEQRVAAGRGDDLIQMPDFWYIASAASIVDRMANTPDMLELAAGVRCPTLFIRGADESADLYPAERFKALAPGSCSIELIADCDHFYKGAEERTAAIVKTWLQRAI